MCDVWVEMLHIADSVTASVGPTFFGCWSRVLWVICCCITNSPPPQYSSLERTSAWHRTVSKCQEPECTQLDLLLRLYDYVSRFSHEVSTLKIWNFLQGEGSAGASTRECGGERGRELECPWLWRSQGKLQSPQSPSDNRDFCHIVSIREEFLGHPHLGDRDEARYEDSSWWRVWRVLHKVITTKVISSARELCSWGHRNSPRMRTQSWLATVSVAVRTEPLPWATFFKHTSLDPRKKNVEKVSS